MRLVQITDPHLRADGSSFQGLDNEYRWAQALAAAQQLAPDLLLLSGDFCAELPKQSTYQKLRPQLEDLAIPYALLAGNHDSRKMLRSTFGFPGAPDAPIYYQKTVGDRQLLALDSSKGELEAEQLEWLTTALANSSMPMLAIHHPPCPMGARFMDSKYPLKNYQPLVELLQADGRPIVVLCGHYHFGQQLQSKNLQVYCCPPTSFFIDPLADEFVSVESPPALQMIEWEEGQAATYICTRFV